MSFFRIFFFSIFLLTFSSKSFAMVSFAIDGEGIAKNKILFFGFNPTNPALRSDAQKILNQIKLNLGSTNLFNIVEHTSRMEVLLPDNTVIANLNNDQMTVTEDVGVDSIPNFNTYDKIGVGAIVVGQFSYDQLNNLEVRIRMWDVLDQRQLFGKYYTSSSDNYQKTANVISDEIFKSITGEKKSHFNSKILYVSESGPMHKRAKRIAMVDFDGSNKKFLTDGRNLVLTPIFSKKRDEIFYLKYFQGKPQIFSMNIENLRGNKVGGFRGTTFAAATHPKDPNKIILSSIVRENSDIYELDIVNNSAVRLTKSLAIDTTPSYSPDADYVVFASDREGSQQIYLMDSDGSSIRRISSKKGAYAKPVWSPDGKFICFTKMKDGQFFIGIMSPNGGGEKLLATGYLVEGAKWSPSGRYIIYSKKRGPYGDASIPKLYVVDIITGHEYKIPTPKKEGATDPDWI